MNNKSILKLRVQIIRSKSQKGWHSFHLEMYHGKISDPLTGKRKNYISYES